MFQLFEFGAIVNRLLHFIKVSKSANNVNFPLPGLVMMMLSSRRRSDKPGGRRGTPFYGLYYGCAAGQGMVFVLSVLNSVYNFARVCPKQGIQFRVSLPLTVICASLLVPSRSNDCNMISQLQLPINGFKTTQRAFCPLS